MQARLVQARLVQATAKTILGWIEPVEGPGGQKATMSRLDCAKN